MSRETLEWLNVMTLIGDTEVESARKDMFRLSNGKAWTYRAALQGDEPNHYPGAIPVADVRRRLFNWKPVRGDVKSTGMNESGVFTLTDPNSIHTLRPPGSLSPDDPGAILGHFKKGYKIHDYDEWLIKNVESILDSDLHVSSAGLLREGAQAWVAITVPEIISTPEGVEFRPYLYAATSLNGSIATGYGVCVQLPLCDNSLAISRGEKGRKIKLKHTTNSLDKIGRVREELGIEFAREAIDEGAAAFAAEVAELTNITVTDDQWAKFLAETAPAPDEKGRSRTLAMNQRAELEQLYRYDERCKQWSGTAFGVLQAVNTHRHHVGIVRGMSRPLRNMDRLITGGVDELDTGTLATLDKVLASA
jgi:phage/plasmid-like protein (TIGR03299 family)